MLLPLPLNMDGLRRVLGAGATVLIVVLLIYAYLARTALERAELAYRNPRVVAQTRVVKIQGPIRIVTKIVETPARKETTVEETRGPEQMVLDTGELSEPVLEPAAASDRWLVGGSLESFRPRDRAAWTVYGGYSFRNHVDLALGLTGAGKPVVLGMFRF